MGYEIRHVGWGEEGAGGVCFVAADLAVSPRGGGVGEAR